MQAQVATDGERSKLPRGLHVTKLVTGTLWLDK